MSNLSAIEYIQNLSAGTTGLWNQRYSVISANFAALNSDLTLNSPSGDTFSIATNIDVVGGGHFQFLSVGSTPASESTTAAITIAVNSNFSDYLYLTDSSAQRSNYVLGSRAGGTGDGLNLWDSSGDTMIVGFSKQSTRFYSPVVGYLTDLGSAQFNVRAYGAKGDGVTDDTGSILLAISAASIAGGGQVLVPSPGTYKITSPLTMQTNIFMVGGYRGSVIEPHLDATHDAIIVPAGVKRVQFQQLYVDAAGGQCRDCISVQSGADDVRFLLTWTKSAFRHGIYIENCPTTLIAPTSEQNGSDGMYVTFVNSGNPVHVVGGYFYNNSGNGITLDANANLCMIQNAEIITNGAAGIAITSSKHAIVNGNLIQTNGVGIVMSKTAGNSPNYASIVGNNIVQNSQDGIRMTNAHYCSVIGNAFVDNSYTAAGTYDAMSVSACTGLVIQGNHFINQDGVFQNNGVNIGAGSGCVVGGNYFSNIPTNNIAFASDSAREVYNNSPSVSAPITQQTLKTAKQFVGGVTTVTYDTVSNMVVDASTANFFRVLASDANPFTFAGPTNAPAAGFQQEVVFEIANTSGGTSGLPAFAGGAGGYVLSSPLTVLASATTLLLGFRYDQSANRWYEGYRSHQANVESALLAKVFVGPGTAAIPSMAFSSETSLGFYRSGNSTIAQSFGTFLASNITATGTITALNQIVAQGASAAFKLGAGDGSRGQITLDGASNTLFDYLGTFAIRSISGGYSNSLSFDTVYGKVRCALGWLANTGTNKNPSYGFSSESSLGFYYSGVSTVGLAYGAFVVPDGSNTTPSLALSSNTSVGFYSSGVQTIAQSLGTLNLATNSVRFSMRTLAASSVTASAAKTNVATNEVVFTIGGASGASLIISSGGTAYIFNSAASAILA